MLLLVDLDGVVFRDTDAVPGMAAVLTERAAVGDELVYVTNNSMLHRTRHAERLCRIGAPFPDHVVSAPRAAGLFLKSRSPVARRVLVVGEPGLRDEVRDAGLEVVDAWEAASSLGAGPGTMAHTVASGAVGSPGAEWTEAPGSTRAVAAVDILGGLDALVVGLDTRFNYRVLALVSDLVQAGLLFVAINRDGRYPTARGIRPGAGSIVLAIESASGAEPVTIGKPSPLILIEAADSVGRRARDAVVIGDGLATDMAAAREVGARGVLMLTGATSRAQVDALAMEDRPDAIASDASELRTILADMAVDTPARSH